jgi:hypothetical protein
VQVAMSVRTTVLPSFRLSFAEAFANNFIA